jgi:hypothetical protein
MPERPHFIESPEVLTKYETLKNIGIPLFKDNIALSEGQVGPREVELAKQFLAEGARAINPDVTASFWSHVLTAPEIGKRTAELAQKGGIDVDSNLVEFGLWFHEVGRLVTPGDFLHNDLIADRLQVSLGIPRAVFESTDTLGKLLAHADTMELTEEQLQLKDGLNDDQLEQAKNYFDQLSPSQRIANLADNLSKRNANGLFDRGAFIDYLRTQEERAARLRAEGQSQLSIESPRASIAWGIQRRRAGAVLQLDTIDRTINWLNDHQVDWDNVREELSDYDTKLEVVLRHGDLDNPITSFMTVITL